MQLKDLTVNFLGDSITEGVGVSDLTNRYDNRLKAKYGFKKVNNYGIDGTRIAHQRMPSEKPRNDLCFCGRAYDMDKTADLVIVYGGVNDYIRGDAPFGQKGDTTPATFCGAVFFLIKLLKELFPDKPIVFMTPARMHYKGQDDTLVSYRPGKHETAKPLIGYVEAIKDISKDFGVPTVDLYHDLGISAINEADREKYTVDGLHFNDEGHFFIAEALGKVLEKI